MGIILFRKPKHQAVFRKVAMGTWNQGGDPSVYGILEIDMTNALNFIEQMSHQYSVKLTPAHLVGKALALVMMERPEINGMIRFNKIYYRQYVDLFYQVNVSGEKDHKISKANLSGTVVKNAEKKSVIQIAEDLNNQSKKIREGDDPLFKSTFDLFKILPWSLSALSLKIFSFLNYDLNLNLSSLGLPKDPFGSAMITNVGSLGIDVAFAPLVPYSRVPLLLALGRVHETPVAHRGEVVIRPMMKIGVTFDHRFIDGIHASEMAKLFKQYMNEPEKYLM